MGEIEHKRLKKVTKVLLSISFFSLFFTQISWLYLFHSLKFYFSTLPFQLFTHSIDKNCMFLLCNGLLVFVAKGFGLINFSKPKSKLNQSHEPIKDYLTINPQPLEIEVPQELSLGESTNQNSLENQEEVIVKIPTQELMIVEDGEEQEGDDHQSGFLSTKWVLVDQDGEEEEEKRPHGGFSNTIIDGEQEEQEAEKLNKKFEEFIRKMKEELRIEARKKLVMV
ncbi:retrotransposon-like protein 1 [Tripterygium wilfordii]|uniref:Retrotransposon-like protein 1 n=1 Tax=Tripterygium wilfordii TaxID=458696 RepID=A0A7J7C177_TRIWF|nr:retrotransposon-like protein 1 [Tripterygium wilfordii]